MRKLLIVAVLGMVLAIVACGPGAEPTPTSTPVVVATPTPTPGVVATPTPTAKPLATATATPKRGGILKVRHNKIITTFYVHQTTSWAPMSPAYNTLVAQDPLDVTSEKIVPDLADRWEISSDGLTITFFLRKGVKWSDGVPFTSADIKYNLDLIRTPPTGFASPRKDLFDAVASISTPDDYTVVLKMKRISNSILSTLASSSQMIAPKHVMEKDVLHALDNVMVGTGPYLFRKFTPEGIMVFERKPDYFKPGLPYLDGIQIIPIADNNALIAALYTGGFDTNSAASRSLGKTDMQRIQKERPGLLQGVVTGTSFMLFELNTQKPPFTDQRVRVAVQDSIDRASLLNTSSSLGAVSGYKPSGTFFALPPEELAKLPGFGPDILARRAQARQLLKDAGIAAGTEITLSAKSNEALYVELEELIQLQLLEALPSLNVKIRNYSAAEYIAAHDAGNLQATVDAGNVNGSDPDFYGVYYVKGGSRNTAGISDPRIDELYAKQTTMLDPAQRRLAVWELDKLVIQTGAWSPLFSDFQVCVAWPYVKNQVCASDPKGVGAVYEIVWLDK